MFRITKCARYSFYRQQRPRAAQHDNRSSIHAGGCSAANSENTERPSNDKEHFFEPWLCDALPSCLGWAAFLAATFQLTGVQWQRNASLAPALALGSSGNAVMGKSMMKMRRPMSSPNLRSVHANEESEQLECACAENAAMFGSTALLGIAVTNGQASLSNQFRFRDELQPEKSYSLYDAVVKDQSLLPSCCDARPKHMVMFSEKSQPTPTQKSPSIPSGVSTGSKATIQTPSTALPFDFDVGNLGAVVENQVAAMALDIGGLDLMKHGERSKAVEYFSSAHALDFPPATFHLGQCYDEGLGVERNPAQAKKLYKKSADGGHSAAALQMFKLSFAEQNFHEAAVYFKKAKEDYPELKEILLLGKKARAAARKNQV